MKTADRLATARSDVVRVHRGWLAGWAVLVAVAAPVIAGPFDPRLTAGAVLPVAIGLAAIVWAPKLSRDLPWRRLLILSMLGAAAWALALALIDGTRGIVGPVTLKDEYLAGLRFVSSPLTYLAHFTAHAPRYPIHVRGHPPGMVLVLWVMSRAGLGGASWAAALMIGGGAAAVPAVLIATREVAGEDVARRSAPFLAFAPAAIWIASSADAFYAGVLAWGIALVIVGAGRERQRVWIVAAGGVLLGASMFLSYGMVLGFVIPVVVLVARRRWESMAVACAGILAVVIAFWAAGFWWPAGFVVTRRAYLTGAAARNRDYWYFFVANLGAAALAAGPAVAAGIASVRHRGVWLLAGGALASMIVADLSGMSKGEVERIWLPFVVWVLVATARISRRGSQRAWLALQMATALVVSLLIRTTW